MGKKLIKNTLYAFIAQGVSLLLNIIIALFIPKVLGVKEFSYWQLYLFYFSYIGFFHFGLNDGIYLKYGGMNENELPYQNLGSQFKFAWLYQTILAILFIIFTSIFVNNSERQFVMYMIALTMVINNLALYLGYVFQAVNKTDWFSFSVILDKAVIFVLILIFVLLKIDDFRIYIFLYLIGRTAALIYCIVKGRNIVFSKSQITYVTVKEAIDNISIGINLMFANIASVLIIGLVRFIVDGKWGIETFGKFSLAISMESFVLMFISQISMVIFPVLRRINEKRQYEVYKIMRDVLSLVLPIAFLLYPFMAFLLKYWLPKYEDSILYLALLLPICTYDGKMNLLCTTYFKVLRKEKILLNINLFTMVISLMFGLVGAYILDNIVAIAVGLVAAVAIRSIVSEIYLSKMMNTYIIKDVFLESILVIVFILAAYNLNYIQSFIILLIVYFVYILLNYKKVKSIYIGLLSLTNKI